MKKELIPQVFLGVALLIIIVVILLSIQGGSTTSKDIVKYVPMGDSFSAGTGVGSLQSWTSRIVSNLNKENIRTEITNNLSSDGYTTQDLIDFELDKLTEMKPDVVTLLIGMNDFLKGVEKEKYKENLERIISVTKRNISNSNNIIIITIPDFTETPQGKLLGEPQNIRDGIQEYNDILKEVAKSNNIDLVDVFELSTQLNKDVNLISRDGLHPSYEAQLKWTEMIFPVFRSKLTK